MLMLTHGNVSFCKLVELYDKVIIIFKCMEKIKQRTYSTSLTFNITQCVWSTGGE